MATRVPNVAKKMVEEQDPAEDQVMIKSGKGFFAFPDGSTYNGEYIVDESNNKQRHGQGTLKDGQETYSGEWKADSMNGKGSYEFSTGDRYEGEFKANLFQGQGTYIWRDGASYTGEWRSNKMHGEGCYTDAEGSSWKGKFSNGKYSNGRAFFSLR